ncbi:unnamed protein product [Somion occarium]|uniref:Aminoglycoside phosphotransferase domain-containing protein n=1 Tax=Somion occarium TaxID=3059160 RepID=A0ABP1CLU6_9APHY
MMMLVHHMSRVAFLIVLHRQDVSHISATYNTYDVSSSHANWFLLHCALGFEALQSARPSSALRSTSLITKAEDALFCSPAIPSRYDESQIRVLKFDVDFLHQTFLRRIQYQPLSDCMRTSSGTVVSCLTTHLIAARLASRLSQIGVYNGDVVYIGLQDASHVAICTVAVLYTGAGFAIMSTPPVCEAPVLSSQKSLVVLVEHSRATEWLVTATRAVLFDPTDIIMELSTKDQVSRLRDNLGNDTFAIGSPTSSKIAYAVSTMTTQYQEFLVVDHRQACDAMRRHHSQLFRGASPRFVVLTGVGNHYLGNVVWHAFWSGAAITFLGENDKDKLLNRVVEFNCNHIIVPEDEFEQVAKILIHAHKYMHGQSELHEQAGVSGLRSLKNIVVCCPGPITGQSVETLRNESVETRSDYSGLRHNLKPTIKHPIEVLYSDPAEHDVAPHYILEKIPTGTLPHASFGAVVKISESLLVKYNQRVRKAEADMMIYVQLHTTIHVPRVILIFRQGEVTYIVMELVPGRNLQEVWDDLDTVTRQTVMAQISSYIGQMRALPRPSGAAAPGPIDGSRCRGPWFTFYDAGPFDTYSALSEWLNHKLDISLRSLEHVKPGVSSRHRRFTTDHPLVLTHQDLAPRNFMLDSDNHVWMLDWDSAGWYPLYFEYACVRHDRGGDGAPIPDGWKEALLTCLEEYEEEYQLLLTIEWVLTVYFFH